MFTQTTNSEKFDSTYTYYKLLIHFENTSLECANLVDISSTGMKIDMYSLADIPLNCTINATLYNLSNKEKPTRFSVQGKVIQSKSIPRTHKTLVEISFHDETELPDDILATKFASMEFVA